MTLTDQVCSLDIAKRLRELGVKQKSIFVWEYYDDQCHAVKYIPYAIIPDSYNKFEWYAAYTVAELGILLPCGVQSEKYQADRWTCYYPDKINTDGSWFKGNTEADARGKMLIHLLENRII